MEKELSLRFGKEAPYDQSITNLRCDADMSRERGRSGQGKMCERNKPWRFNLTESKSAPDADTNTNG